MNITTKRTLAFLATVLCVCFGAWLMGYDFNERGAAATAVFVISIFYGALFASYPFEK